jgi:prepilin-type processing-associated H-X9-DG protein
VIANTNTSRGIAGQLSEFTSTAKTVMIFETASPRPASTDMPNREFRLMMNPSGDNSPAGNGMSGTLNTQDGGSNNAWYATGCTGGQTCPAPDMTWGAGTMITRDGRHIEGANYAMADGHVKWYRPEKVSPGFTALTAADAQDHAGTTKRAAGTSNAAYQVTWSTR